MVVRDTYAVRSDELKRHLPLSLPVNGACTRAPPAIFRSSLLFYSISELFDCTLKSIPPESNKREAVISVHEVVICTPTRCWDSSEELGAVVRTTTARNLFFASEAVKSTRTRLSILGTLCVQYISTTAHGANSSEINALTLGQTRVYCSLVLKLSLSSIPPIAFQSL